MEKQRLFLNWEILKKHNCYLFHIAFCLHHLILNQRTLDLFLDYLPIQNLMWLTQTQRYHDAAAQLYPDLFFIIHYLVAALHPLPSLSGVPEPRCLYPLPSVLCLLPFALWSHFGPPAFRLQQSKPSLGIL